MGQYLDEARDLIQKGLLRDQRIYGDPSDWKTNRLSFSSPVFENLKQKSNPDGSVLFEADFVFGDKDYSEGFHFDHGVREFLQQYPEGKRDLIQAFIEVAKKARPDVISDARRWFTEQTIKPFMDLVGYHESRDWEEPVLVSFKGATYRKPANDYFGKFGRDIHIAVVFHASIKAMPKAAITKAPFDDMTDRELDKWIEKWEGYAPENFWMDGELRVSRPRAYAMYRDRWRKMRPREQVEMMESLTRNYRGASLHLAFTRVGKADDWVFYADDPESIVVAKLRIKEVKSDNAGGTFNSGLKRLPGGRSGFGGSGTTFWDYNGVKFQEERSANGRNFWGTDVVISKVPEGKAAALAAKWYKKHAGDTAAQAYEKRSKAVLRDLAELQTLLGHHAKDFEKTNSLDWGFVGDLTRIGDELKDVLSWVKGN